MSFNLKDYFEQISRDDYQRENFDDFLKKANFKYNVPSIHIAGSNGKGSTANYLANIYKEHGLKVGLFISPYLNDVNEMISINGNLISDDDFAAAIKENEKLFNKYSLSPFEIQTYIALSYFEKNRCDIAIIECGMGGEIDATNIFNPIAAVITSISLEHTSYLGRSLCEIAYQKAGIIKERVPVITGILQEEALNTIVEVSKENLSQLFVAVDPANVVYEDYGYNFAYLTYKNLRRALLETYPISEEEIAKGLAETYMPARMEIMSKKPLLIIDGSHNPEGIQNMVTSLPNLANGKDIHVVFACFKDKNIERMLAFLGEYSKDIVLTTFPNRRSRVEEDYFLYLDDYSFNEDPLAALKQMRETYPEDAILVTGSFTFAAYMKNLIKRG